MSENTDKFGPFESDSSGLRLGGFVALVSLPMWGPLYVGIVAKHKVKQYGPRMIRGGAKLAGWVALKGFTKLVHRSST